MKVFHAIALTVLAMLMQPASAIAEDNALKGTRLGFAYDRGFYVIGTMARFNIFAGIDGVAVN